MKGRPMPILTLLRTRPINAHPLRLLSHFLRHPWQAAAFRRSRRALSGLDDHLLADIGISRAEAEAEARRPDWDVPLHWRN